MGKAKSVRILYKTSLLMYISCNYLFEYTELWKNMVSNLGLPGSQYMEQSLASEADDLSAG